MTSPASIAIRSARVLTLDGPPGASRGPSMSDVAAVDNCDVVIRGDVIEAVAPDAAKNIDAATTIDADGRVVMPAFIDAHTHACWAGDRLDEWQARMQGASYLELLERGGGIMSTVRAVREATEAELTDLLVERLDRATAEGTTAIEIKSG
ncbi:MAG: imidazolonepropionase, partial [Phycisphaerae bacterium]|nr:imidazolonepropionase [Phycisphaerae bacterium]